MVEGKGGLVFGAPAEGAVTRAWDQGLILVGFLAVCAALIVLAWQGWRR